MKKQTVHSLGDLRRSLVTDAMHPGSGPLAVIGGHYPLSNEGYLRPSATREGLFGVFPEYTLRLGLDVMIAARKEGNAAKLALLVDDHSQYRGAAIEDIVSLHQRYFDEFDTFGLPEPHRTIFKQKGFSQDDLIASKFGSRAFQESRYRQEFAQETGMHPGCAGEFRLILEDLAAQGFRLVIGLIPAVCKSPTCAGLDFYRGNKSNPTLRVTLAYLDSSNDEERRDNAHTMVKRTNESWGGIHIIRV